MLHKQYLIWHINPMQADATKQYLIENYYQINLLLSFSISLYVFMGAYLSVNETEEYRAVTSSFLLPFPLFRLGKIQMLIVISMCACMYKSIHKLKSIQNGRP